jgi:hypothetical protein
MQIETRVKLETDGTATITERVRFSNRILDMKLDGSGVPDMNTLLAKSTAERRAQQLGETCKLVSFDAKPTANGKEIISVYKIDDLNQLRYVSPYVSYLDYASNNAIKFRLEPVYKSRPYQDSKAGEISVALLHEKPPKGTPPLDKNQKPPAGPAPSELQIFRELMPAVKDMLEGFEFRLTFESYANIKHTGHGLRNKEAKPTEIDLFWFNDRQLDKYGSRFLDNEEVCLALVRLDFGDRNLVEQMRDYATNNTMPVMFPLGSATMWHSGGKEIGFAPSKALFDKFFTGKKLDHSEWQASSPDKHVDADFSKIGWKGEGK